MIIKRKLTAIGSYFFIFGAVIALFDLAFETPESLLGTKLFILLITSITVGVINIAGEQKYKFMLSSLSFALFMYIFSDILQNYIINITTTFPWEHLFTMFTDMVLLVLPASLIVAISELVEIMSIKDENVHEAKLIVDSEKSQFEKIWDTVVIIAVAIAIIIFILPLTFDVGKYQKFLLVLDLIILAIFIFDLFILYRRSKNWRSFLSHHWIDLLAVLPFNSFFQVAKLARVSKIIKVASKTTELSKAAHVAKLLRANHTMKYFSAEKKLRRNK